ncbi:phosphoribosylglycinamide formyltransferase [Gracilimonas sp.]|uniref:phosphoribosylglycinamide formyltransferase n=1 Tax=Gracilimonas sp. TaxID=1974203 RepID=UPI002870E8A2|nr:phosphoribosylglycinamide formyltransferase [Gracilimonas sp.]
MKNLVVFASGSGTNFQSIIDAVESGELTANIAGLITNKPNIGALERALTHGIPSRIISPQEYSTEDEFAEELLKQLRAWGTDLIALAGYLKKIPSSVIREYENRILNIHPALLPKFGGKGFYGLNVHKAVIEAGEKESGCSVHIVTEEFDEGPVITQKKVPVQNDDTPKKLAQRILEQEHKLYPEAIQNHLKTLKT